jgi:ArsR family transcriptional regulator
MKDVGTPLDLGPMRAAARTVSALMRTLANEDRLLLLCQISQGEKSVGELEALVDIRQPTLSQQLGVLRSEGVVSTRREGKKIYYAIADVSLLEILAVLYRLYCPKE